MSEQQAPQVVTLPYRSPQDRTLATLRREAIQAGIAVAAVGLSQLITRLVDEPALDTRTVILMVAMVLIKALATVAAKWDRTTTEEAS